MYYTPKCAASSGPAYLVQIGHYGEKYHAVSCEDPFNVLVGPGAKSFVVFLSWIVER